MDEVVLSDYQGLTFRSYEIFNIKSFNMTLRQKLQRVNDYN